jgi:hypothetical protein
MSLLSVDITQPKILSLWEDIPAPQPAEEPPTLEEIGYSTIVAINPLIEELLQELQPVSIYTGKPIRKVKLPQDITDRINKVNIVI